jgi:ATP-binding cassette, subfamily C (CFTR/MRP), member 1
VTHGITYLPDVDNIIVLKEGEVSEVGTYNELIAKKGAFAEFLLQHLQEREDDSAGNTNKKQFDLVANMFSFRS